MMSNRINGLPVAEGGSGAGNRSGAGVTGGFAAGLRRLLRCKRGVGAVEFGLAAPVLLAVLVPVADLGIAFATQQQLRQTLYSRNTRSVFGVGMILVQFNWWWEHYDIPVTSVSATRRP